jgi:hypothetical protein
MRLKQFVIDIWHQPEDIDEYKRSGALGCPDEEYQFDTLDEAWGVWTTPTRAFHMQLIHYPNRELLREWGDGCILAEGTTDDNIMLMELGLKEGDE